MLALPLTMILTLIDLPILTTPVAHVCLHNGECASLPSGLEFSAMAECEAQKPVLYSSLVIWLTRQGMAYDVLTAEVECVPMGLDG